MGGGVISGGGFTFFFADLAKKCSWENVSVPRAPGYA